MSTRDRQIEAAGLFTREDVRRLGSSLKNVYRAAVDAKPAFGDLLEAFDTAEPEQAQPIPSSQADESAVRGWRRAFIGLYGRE